MLRPPVTARRKGGGLTAGIVTEDLRSRPQAVEAAGLFVMTNCRRLCALKRLHHAVRHTLQQGGPIGGRFAPVCLLNRMVVRSGGCVSRQRCGNRDPYQDEWQAK